MKNQTNIPLDVNETLINELGFGDLPPEQQVIRLRQFAETLQLNVLMALEDNLTDEQLKQLQSLEGDRAIADWFSKNVPDYDKIVERERVKLIESLQRKTAQYKKSLLKCNKTLIL